MTPPTVSMPSDNGVTSSSSTCEPLPSNSCAPWMAAPTATTSSGLTPLCPSLPKISFTICCTRGIRVMPPTRTTSSMSLCITRVLECLQHRAAAAFDQVMRQLFQLGARQIYLDVLGAVLIHRDKRQIDPRRRYLRQFFFGLLASILEPLQCLFVLAQVDAMLLLEF